MRERSCETNPTTKEAREAPALGHGPFGGCLNLDFLIEKPKGSPLVEEYLNGAAGAAPFYSGSWREPADFIAVMEAVDRRFDRDRRRRALECVRPSAWVPQERLDAWVEAGGAMVTTGQQPGLFGGPLYSLYKGLTAVRLAERLEALLERPVLPVFWVASEDHDWAEADHTYLIDTSNDLVRLQVDDPGHGDRALHRITLNKELDRVVAQAVQVLPTTDFSSPYIELIRDSYDSGSTLAEGFSGVLGGLLEPLGVLFAEAAGAPLKEASVSVLLRELDNAEAHEGLLKENSAGLEVAGFSAQVPILDGGVNLFLEGPRGRERLYRNGDGFELYRSGEIVSSEEVRDRSHRDPRSLSPNVLLRPIVESSVFPVVSYVAGPGEMAYYAQIQQLYEAHGLTMPVIFPRYSVTIVEAKVRKKLDKFGLDLEDLRRPPHEVVSELARQEMPEEVRRALRELRGDIDKGVGRLMKAAVSIDSTLAGPVTHARNAALAALQDVERKIVQSVKRENEIALRQVEVAQRHLFPEGKPQERVLNALYYLTRYGNSFIEALVESFEVDLPDGTE